MPVLDARAPARAPGVELLGELTGSGYHGTPGLVRRGDGQTVQLTPLLYHLLRSIDGVRGDDELAAELSRQCGKLVAAADVRHLLHDKLEPLGLLRLGDGSAPETQKPEPLLGLKLKVVVSDPAVTRRLTTPFTWLFRSWVVVPVLLAFAATCWWVLWEKGLAQATRQAFFEPELLLAVFALTVLSAGFHEFGHAAACRQAGATPGAMGAGLYLVWPAFYTDVDDSYRLSRWGRLKVDLGGLYFNALIAVGVTALWMVTRKDALLLGVATQLLQMVRQLAPVIRADGYHILADLTGVPDLFSHLRPTLLGLLPSNWGKPQPLKRWARVVVSVWVLVVVPVLLALLVLAVLILPRLVATASAGLSRQADGMQAAASRADIAEVLARLLSMGALVLPVAAIGYLLIRLVRRTTKKVWSGTAGRPAARSASVLLGALLLGLLAWSWWPDGQYRPVRSDERGTLPALTADVGTAGTPRASVVRGLPGVRPQTALALVPRDGSAPALLLTRDGSGGLRSVLASGPADGSEGEGVSLPLAPPSDDNRAAAVNTTDGSTVYDVAVALVWVKDGRAATSRNEAYALASCRSCTTVAVAFQVVLVVGRNDVVAPVNVAVAANTACVECVTRALAVQLVATLKEMPTDEVRAQIEQAVSRLDDLQGVSDLYAEVKAVEQQVLTLLVDNGLIELPTPAPTPTLSPGAAVSSPAPPAAPSLEASPSASAPADASAAPEASAAPAASSPEPSAEAAPTSDTSQPSSEPSPAPSP